MRASSSSHGRWSSVRAARVTRADAAGLGRALSGAAYLVLPAASRQAVPREVVAAFAEGVPVIAARAGTQLELVVSGRNGLFFHAGSAADLARRLAWADAFPEKMRQMGECARADYRARFISDWSYRTLFGERRRSARL